MNTLLENDVVYVLNKREQLIAEFQKDDEETIINPKIKEIQNSEATLSFIIPRDNSKWEKIQDPENLYVADGKVFSANFDGCFTEKIADSGEETVEILAYERERLLDRVYVTSYNSSTGYEKIDNFMVVILSGGKESLMTNGELVNSPHVIGTSGYALDAILAGTGWTTGECTVEGIFDLETEQLTVYENILKIQEIWGGILTFDSVNKVIHHRSETLYLPYNGYETRYAKNMQSLEKKYNNKIVTKLCPLGEAGLNIASVNGGSIWLTNNSYTDSVLEGIENNADITDPAKLKAWGERKLKNLCKPVKELTVQTVLLHQTEGYEQEVINLNDLVDVIDYEEIKGNSERLRVVEFEHNLWDLSDASVTLSDITLDSTNIFKKTVSAANLIKNGTLNANKVVDFFKGESIDNIANQATRRIENITFDLYENEEEGSIGQIIRKTSSDVNDLTGEIVGYSEQFTDIWKSIKGLEVDTKSNGGRNLIKNSVGIFGSEYWEGKPVRYTGSAVDVVAETQSQSAFVLQNGRLFQEIVKIKNGTYNVSFVYRTLSPASVNKVKINDTEYPLENTTVWKEFQKVIEITDNYFSIDFISDTNDSELISDLLLIPGTLKQNWSQNANETNGENVKIGKGIQVDSTSNNNYTRLDADGLRVFNAETNNVVFRGTDVGAEMKELKVNNKAEIVHTLIQYLGGQVCINVID